MRCTSPSFRPQSFLFSYRYGACVVEAESICVAPYCAPAVTSFLPGAKAGHTGGGSTGARGDGTGGGSPVTGGQNTSRRVVTSPARPFALLPSATASPRVEVQLFL